MLGDIATIYDAIEAWKNKGLILKIVDGLQDYLSWKIKFLGDNKCAQLGQRYLIQILDNKFDGLINKVWSHKTPIPPSFELWDLQKISRKSQSKTHKIIDWE